MLNRRTLFLIRIILSTTGADLASRVAAQEFIVTTFAGSPGHAGSSSGAALGGAQFDSPQGVVVASDGTVYVADTGNSTVRKIAVDGTVSTIAGVAGQTGTANGKGSEARFFYPSGLAIDGHGDLLVADTFNHAVRKVTPEGVVTTFAGKPGTAGSAEGLVNLARFRNPSALAVDAAGNIYVADSGNDTIRVISANGTVSTLAGKAGQVGSVDGFRTAARFSFPSGIALVGDKLWVADTQNHSIRVLTLQGMVSTIAGQAGVPGVLDGNGLSATFRNPRGMVVDSQGAVFLGDELNHVIRSISPNRTVTLVAGVAGDAGTNNGPSLTARFARPTGLAVDGADTVFIADTANHVIRKTALAHPRPTRIIQLDGDLNFGEVNLKLRPTRILTIANRGDTTLQVANIVTPDGFSAQWTGLVEPHSASRVAVTFSPVAARGYSGQVVVQSDATAGRASVDVAGVGAAFPMPEISLSGDLSFGGVLVGTREHRSFTLSNSGSAPLHVIKIEFPKGFSGGLNAEIPPGESRKVDVEFLPAIEASFGGNVRIISDAGSGEELVPCFGFGVGKIRHELTYRADLPFPDIEFGNWYPELLLISNEGSQPVTVDEIQCPPGFTGSWTGTIAAGGFAGVDIVFAPTSVGAFRGAMAIVTGNRSETNYVQLSGTGIAGKGDNGWHVEPLYTRVVSPVGSEILGQSLDFRSATKLAVGPRNQLALSFANRSVIKYISALGAVGTLAGNDGMKGNADGVGTNARFDSPSSIAYNESGELFVIDAGTVRRVGLDGVVMTIDWSDIPGSRTFQAVSGYGADGAVAVDETGNLFGIHHDGSVFQIGKFLGKVESLAAGLSDTWLATSYVDSVVYKLTADNTLRTIGYIGQSGYRDGNDLQAMFAGPIGISTARSGNAYVVDYRNRAVRKIAAGDGATSTILGSPGASPSLNQMFGKNVYFLDLRCLGVDSDENLVLLVPASSQLLRGIRRQAPRRALDVSVYRAFGTVALGSSSTVELKLSNWGDTLIHVNKVIVPAGFTGGWSGDLFPGKCVSVPLRFAPTQLGKYQGPVLVDSDANQGSDAAYVAGVGVEKAVVDLAIEGDLDFGDRVAGTSATNYVSIINHGNVSFRIAGVVLPEGFYGAKIIGLSPGTTNRFPVIFRPDSVRDYSGRLMFSSDAGDEKLNLPVRGRGVAVAPPGIETELVRPQGPLIIKWPGSAAEFVLESRQSLGGADVWAPFMATNGIGIVEGYFSLPVNTDGRQSYFRLRKP